MNHSFQKIISNKYFVIPETTNGLPVLTGIFYKEYTVQVGLGFTISKKHCVADPETSKT